MGFLIQLKHYIRVPILGLLFLFVPLSAFSATPKKATSPLQTKAQFKSWLNPTLRKTASLLFSPKSGFSLPARQISLFETHYLSSEDPVFALERSIADLPFLPIKVEDKKKLESAYKEFLEEDNLEKAQGILKDAIKKENAHDWATDLIGIAHLLQTHPNKKISQSTLSLGSNGKLILKSHKLNIQKTEKWVSQIREIVAAEEKGSIKTSTPFSLDFSKNSESTWMLTLSYEKPFATIVVDYLPPSKEDLRKAHTSLNTQINELELTQLFRVLVPEKREGDFKLNTSLELDLSKSKFNSLPEIVQFSKWLQLTNHLYVGSLNQQNPKSDYRDLLDAYRAMDSDHFENNIQWFTDPGNSAKFHQDVSRKLKRLFL